MVDVCVIGAGIAGLSTAYELISTGRSVLVLDDGAVGSGETGRTTAHLATAFDDYYGEVERVHGAEAARRLAESFVAGVDRIEAIVRTEGIDCAFARVDGYWYAPEGREEDASTLRDELEASHRVGLRDVTAVERLELSGITPERSPAAVLRFPGQARVHALRYLDGLARAIVGRGGSIVLGARAVEVKDATDDAPCTVRLESGATVRARDVVVATNTPFNDRVTMHTKQAPYRTYVIAARVPRGAVADALFWDTLDPYHYVRLLGEPHESGDDVLIVGGEDHKTGQEDDETSHFGALERWTRARYPITELVAAWSGQVMEPVDYVAFIGRNPGDRHVFIVTGDSGNGMTHGAIAGLLLRDLVTGVDNPWASVFEPSRISLRTLPTWLEENANVGAQFRDYVTPGDVESADQVPPGEGRILRHGAHKLAVYRDETGALTTCTAVCPHLGCIVDWNNAEKSWDCPCHGSRFTPSGDLLNGPASTGLAPASLVGRTPS